MTQTIKEFKTQRKLRKLKLKEKSNNKRYILDFFDNEYKQQAQNRNYQGIASVADGLKPTSRKVIETVLKSTKRWEKVESLANRTADSTEYLGGSSNISGVIVTIAKGYDTSNNIPLLETIGGFGQRLNTKPGEPRYIKASKLSNTEDYFKKIDRNILIQEEFDGIEVEPRFFVPTLPLLLVNGSVGVGFGHAQKILPRNPKEVLEYLIQKLNYLSKNSNKNPSISLLKPYWNGFNGNVEEYTKKGSNGEINANTRTTGVFKIIKPKLIEITELPIGTTLLSYLKKLQSLKDSKKIKSFDDLSDTKKDIFLFKVTLNKKNNTNNEKQKEDLIDLLGLSKSITENFTCISEDNKVLQFSSSVEVINYYIDIKLKYLQKRKDHQLYINRKELLKEQCKYLFQHSVINNKLDIRSDKDKVKADLEKILEIIKSKEKSKELYKELEADGSIANKLLNLPIFNLNENSLKKTVSRITELKELNNRIEQNSIYEMWMQDLNDISF